MVGIDHMDASDRVFKDLLSDRPVTDIQLAELPKGFTEPYKHAKDGSKRDNWEQWVYQDLLTARTFLQGAYSTLTPYDHLKYPIQVFVDPCRRIWWIHSRWYHGPIPNELLRYIRTYMEDKYPGYSS